MGAYLVKRFLLMFPTLLGVALVTFLLIRVIPGDVVELRYSGDRGAVSQEVIDLERKRIGLDQPVWKQLATWLVGLAKLDFGTSMWTGHPIWEEIELRFALSLQVALMATVVSVLLALPLTNVVSAPSPPRRRSSTGRSWPGVSGSWSARRPGSTRPGAP